MKLKAKPTGLEFVFAREPADEMVVHNAVREGALPDICSVLSKVKGVLRAEIKGPDYGSLSPILVLFQIDKDGKPIGLDDVKKAITKHTEDCLVYDNYVGCGNNPKYRVRRFMHGGHGYVLCEVYDIKGRELGVSVHYFEDGKRQMEPLPFNIKEVREMISAGNDRIDNLIEEFRALKSSVSSQPTV